MNTTTVYRLIFLLFFSFLFTNASAQNICSDRLAEASKLYDQGLLGEIEEKVASCLRRGDFSREEAVRAKHLILLCHLYLDRTEKAENQLISLLKSNPDYRLNSDVEPAEFTALYKKFRTTPVFSVGLLFGANRLNVQDNINFSVFSDNVSKSYTSPTVSGAGIGLTTTLYIRRLFQLNTDFYYTGYSYSGKSSLFDYTNLSYTEAQSNWNIPIYLGYAFGKKRFQPAVYAGIAFHFLQDAAITATRKNFLNAGVAEVSGQSIDVLAMRNKLNYSALFGVGFQYKVPRGFLFLKANYYIGLQNQNKNNTRYSNSELLNVYGYTDSDFKLNQMVVTLGYTYCFYRPRKLRKYRIQDKANITTETDLK
jgi:hypothetical protein